MGLIYFILCAYGMTQILVYGSIFNNIRPSKQSYKGLGELFHCPMCMGFSVGAFLWSINGFTELFNFEYKFINLLLLGSLSSGSSYVLNMIFGDNGVKHEFICRDEERKMASTTSKTLLQG